jgi:putative inorganic carbon (hco3(-)) transporter
MTLTRNGLVTFAFALVAALCVTASTYAYVFGHPRLLTLAPVGLLAGAGLLALALARFEVFVLAVLGVRTTLDALKLGGAAAIPDPAALLGILFIGVSVIWLITETRRPDAAPFSRLSWAAMVFVAVAFLGVLTSPLPVDSFIEWSRLASMLLMLLVVERLGSRPAWRAHLLGAFATAAVVPLLVAGYQLATNSNLFSAGGFERIRGTFTHSNPLAAFLALLVVVAFAVLTNDRDQRRRVLAGLTLAVSLGGLYLTYTRAAWLAAALGFAVVAATLGRRALATLVGAAVLVVVLVPGISERFSDLSESESARGESANSLTWRVEYWGSAFLLASESPVTGIGLKQIAAQTEEAKQPHNDFVRAYVELGFAGLAAYTYLVWQFVATAVRALRAARGRPRGLAKASLVGFAGAAAGYALMGLVMNLFTQVVVGMYFYAVAGLAVAVIRSHAAPADEDGAALAAPEATGRVM